MSADQTTAQDVGMPIHRAALVPAEWQVQCPACEQWLSADSVRQQHDGSWAAEDEDQFVPCACGVLVEVAPVQVSEVTA